MTYGLPPADDPATAPAVNGGHSWVDTLTGWTAAIPGPVWAAALGLTFIATLAAMPVLRRHAYRAGARTAGRATDPQGRRDRAILAAALTPAALFWAAVLIGSARGLIAFGRDELRWTDGWEYLVPFTLDGIAVSFGVLAFRAVMKGRNPDRANRIAWGAMIASAWINFFHEAGLINGSVLGGGYLALLSLFGMLIFHEFLSQFEDGTAWIKRDNPKFGLRWFTWPTNTACAWVAWRNYPPAEGTKATVGNAVEHLQRVRETKAHRRAERFPTDVWWAPIMPWLRVRQLDAKLTQQRTERAEQHQRITALADRVRALTDQLDDAERRAAEAGEQAGNATGWGESERTARQAAEQEAQRLRDRLTAVTEQLRVARAEQTTGKTKPQDNGTRSTARTTRTEQPASKPTAPRLTDEQAIDLMLREHPEPGYEWGSREVHRLTGAGFGRIPKLIAAVAEHHTREASTPTSERTGSDDSEERTA